jgi:hypothetical protein
VRLLQRIRERPRVRSVGADATEETLRVPAGREDDERGAEADDPIPHLDLAGLSGGTA